MAKKCTKERDARAKLLLCQSKPTALFAVPVLPSSLLKLPNVNGKLGRQQTRAPLAAAISSCNPRIAHDMNDA